MATCQHVLGGWPIKPVSGATSDITYHGNGKLRTATSASGRTLEPRFTKPRG